jgi:hypothetical protein
MGASSAKIVVSQKSVEWTLPRLRKKIEKAKKETTCAPITIRGAYKIVFFGSLTVGTAAFLISSSISKDPRVALLVCGASYWIVGSRLARAGAMLTPEYAMRRNPILAILCEVRINRIFKEAYDYWSKKDDRVNMAWAIMLRGELDFSKYLLSRQMGRG